MNTYVPFPGHHTEKDWKYYLNLAVLAEIAQYIVVLAMYKSKDQKDTLAVLGVLFVALEIGQNASLGIAGKKGYDKLFTGSKKTGGYYA